MMIGQDKEESARFELVCYARNSKGEPTTKKVFRTNSAYKLSEFYDRTSQRPRRKPAKAAKKEGDIQEALTEIQTHGLDKYNERINKIETEQKEQDADIQL